jgi:hypothetical protein
MRDLPLAGINFPVPATNIEGGATFDFSGWFNMPDKTVTIHAYSYWYGADGYWHFDDELTR